MSLNPLLRLASASPRRRELLAQIGVPHAIEVADIDEQVRHGEAVRAYVERVARAKAEAVWQRRWDLPVLGADTTVVLEGVSLGKPQDRAHGLAMLEGLAGREHQVATIVHAAGEPGGKFPRGHLYTPLIKRGHEFLRLDEGEDALPLGVHGLRRIRATGALTGRHFHQRHLEAARQAPGVVLDHLIHPARHALADGDDANAQRAPPPA